MAGQVYYLAVGTSQFNSYNDSNNHQKLGNNLVKFVMKDFVSSNDRLKRGCKLSGPKNCSVIRSSASQNSVVDPVLSHSRSKISETHKKSSKQFLMSIDLYC